MWKHELFSNMAFSHSLTIFPDLNETLEEVCDTNSSEYPNPCSQSSNVSRATASNKVRQNHDCSVQFVPPITELNERSTAAKCTTLPFPVHIRRHSIGDKSAEEAEQRVEATDNKYGQITNTLGYISFENPTNPEARPSRASPE
ncbi:hypothetical protein ACSBR1_004743 [Camellia fascicularis]